MKGLELCEAFYQECADRIFTGGLASYRQYAAFGLAGEGSECYGFDDEFSRDHDFGPDFCVWIPEQIWQSVGSELEHAYQMLPEEFQGFHRSSSLIQLQRRGILTIEGYYMKYTGLKRPPQTAAEWFRIPQSFLSIAVNGKVFEDNSGEFTKWRDLLKAYYPEDVIRKKLASKAVKMGQAGQYNYVRCMNRGDIDAAYLAGGEFVQASLAAIFLLNRQYMPYYKWSFRAAEQLALLQDTVGDLKAFIREPDGPDHFATNKNLIEAICVDVENEMRRQGLSTCRDSFIEQHGASIMEGIRDPQLRSLPALVDND